jgi:hypothetical protein
MFYRLHSVTHAIETNADFICRINKKASHQDGNFSGKTVPKDAPAINAIANGDFLGRAAEA